MSRLSILNDEQMPAGMREQAKAAEEAGAGATVLRVLAHRGDRFESYFKFYSPMHNGGVVDPALKELVRLKIASLNQCLT